MGRYNVNFELSVEDMDLIETALRESKSKLSADRLGTRAPAEEAPNPDRMQEGGDQIRRIHELLGRLHNQKVFFRPTCQPYISG
ncbi:MAG: hypothetical protein AAF484_00375 [Pseudomonadota bacterium]